MNPILAANLVSLGRDFLQTSFTASSDAIPADSKAFQGMLSEACERKVAGASELSTVLDRLGVTTLEEVSEARERLKIDLLANPEVAAFRAQNPDTDIYASRSPEGSVLLHSSNGKTLSLGRDTSAATLLGDYLALSNFLGKDISPDRPGEVLLKT